MEAKPDAPGVNTCESARTSGGLSTPDARAEHLIALVRNGATLEDAGRVYGISRERVRQILKARGINARDFPGRPQRQRKGKKVPSLHPEPAREAIPPVADQQVARVIEALWREGLLYHEIAAVLDISCGDIHRIIRERVPAAEHSAQPSVALSDSRSPAKRILDGMRHAQSALAKGKVANVDERRLAEGLIDGWLSAHPELTEASDAASPARPAGTSAQLSSSDRAGPADLHGALDHFKVELRASGLRESTVHSYLTGSSLFVRWLSGDYVPGLGRAERPRDRHG